MPRYDFSGYYLSTDLSDVTITISTTGTAVCPTDSTTAGVQPQQQAHCQEQLPGHGIVLANVSTYFRAEIDRARAEGQAHPNIHLWVAPHQVPAARALIHFVYKGCLPDGIAQGLAVDTLQLSVAYATPDCTTTCLSTLLNIPVAALDWDTVQQVFSLPTKDLAQAPFSLLANHCLDRLLLELQDLDAALSCPTRRTRLTHLPFPALSRLLADPRTQASTEPTAIAAAHAWLSQHPGAPASQRQQLAGLLQLPRMPPLFVATVLPHLAWLLEVLGPAGLAGAWAATAALSGAAPADLLLDLPTPPPPQWLVAPRPCPPRLLLEPQAHADEEPSSQLCIDWQLPLQQLQPLLAAAQAAAASQRQRPRQQQQRQVVTTGAAAAAAGGPRPAPLVTHQDAGLAPGVASPAGALRGGSKSPAVSGGGSWGGAVWRLASAAATAAAAMKRAASGGAASGAGVHPAAAGGAQEGGGLRRQEELLAAAAMALPGEEDEEVDTPAAAARSPAAAAGGVGGGQAQQQQQRQQVLPKGRPAAAAAAGVGVPPAAAAGEVRQAQAGGVGGRGGAAGCRELLRARSPSLVYAGHSWNMVLYFKQHTPAPQLQQQQEDAAVAEAGAGQQQQQRVAQQEPSVPASPVTADGGGGREAAGHGAGVLQPLQINSQQQGAGPLSRGLWGDGGGTQQQQQHHHHQQNHQLLATPLAVAAVANNKPMPAYDADQIKTAPAKVGARAAAAAAAAAAGPPGGAAAGGGVGGSSQQQQRGRAGLAAAGGVGVGGGEAWALTLALEARPAMPVSAVTTVGFQGTLQAKLAPAVLAAQAAAAQQQHQQQQRTPGRQRVAAAVAAKGGRKKRRRVQEDEEQQQQQQVVARMEQVEGMGEGGLSDTEEIECYSLSATPTVSWQVGGWRHMEGQEADSSGTSAGMARGGNAGGAGAAGALVPSQPAGGEDGRVSRARGQRHAATQATGGGGLQVARGRRRGGGEQWLVRELPPGSYVRSSNCDTGFRDFFEVVVGSWEAEAWGAFMQPDGQLHLRCTISNVV